MDEKINVQVNDEEQEKKKVKYPAGKFSTFCFEWSETIVQTFVVVVLFSAFLFRFLTIDGQSMMNTLHHGDKVAVMKWKYTPKSGDVVVIKHGEEFDKPLVKRIIATGGQSLKINFTEGSVTVDGEKLNETYIKEPMWLRGDAVIPSVVPEGYCFVMGDNRNHSSDSRNKVIGLIPYENIVGKAMFVCYPFSRIKVIK